MRPIAAANRFHLVVSLPSCLRPGGGERIKARLAVVCGGSPSRGNPAALLEPLQRRIKRPVLHQQLFVRSLLDRPRDALPMLRPENQRAQNQQVQCPLQQFQPFRSLLGRHLTRVSPRSGKMST